MSTIPAAGHISNASRTEQELKDDLDAVVACIRQTPGAAVAEVAETIATGTITLDNNAGVFVVDTESAAATDDLANITQTNHPDGACILIRNANAGRVVTVKHNAGGTGQISLQAGVDAVLDDTKKWLFLQRRGTSWYEVFRTPHRARSPVINKTSTYTVAKEDVGKLITCSGEFTVNLLAAASAGNGFVVSIRNTGTGIITLDPNASETIDGLTTLKLGNGRGAILICTGTAWVSSTPYVIPQTDNPIINGTFDVWQYGTSWGSFRGHAVYQADRWMWISADAVNPGDEPSTTYQRSTDVPTLAESGRLLSYSLDIACSDGPISSGSDALHYIRHVIEGYNFRHFAQRDLVCSFWVKSSITGTYCVMFGNGQDRYFIREFSVSSASTWEKKTMTIPASPSGGTWNYTTGRGFELNFVLAAGTTNKSGTKDAWTNFPLKYCTSAQVYGIGTGSSFKLANVELELSATEYPIRYRSFHEELRLCQRYYQKSFNYSQAAVQNAGTSKGEYYFLATVAGAAVNRSHKVMFGVRMRANPTITLYNPSAVNSQVRNLTDAADCASSSGTEASETGFVVTTTGNAACTVGDRLTVHWAAAADY